MALIQPLMVKNFDAVSSVSLTPPAGKSLRVVDIVFNELTANVTIKIEKTYVGYIAKGNSVYTEGSNAYNVSQYEVGGFPYYTKTLMRRLQEMGLPMTYPVAEGETFSLEAEGGSVTGFIVYQLYDAGDVKNTEVNGSAANHYIFVNYGRPSSSITPPGYADVNYAMNPTPFPDFPFGSPVPAGKKILIHSLLINAWGYNSYTGSADHVSRVTYIKVMKDTEVLFDTDMLGFSVYSPTPASGYENVVSNPNASIMPYGYSVDLKGLGRFEPALEFDEGSIVHVQAYVANVASADAIPLTIPYLGVVEEVIAK